MSIAVIGVGLACPLGLRSLPALAAIRAGLRQFDSLDDDERLVCRLEREDDGVDPGHSRSERAEFYAAAALSELMDFCDWTGAPTVHLAAPEPGAFVGLDVADVWARLVARCRRALPRTLRLFASGRAGAFEAVTAASRQLEAGEGQLAIVGGFDSLVDADSLGRLRDDPRIPGEGAAFLLLVRADLLGRGTPSALACFEALTVTDDPEPFASGAPARAVGLAAAVAELRRRGAARVDVVHSAAPSEGRWSQEFTYAYLRNEALMPEPLVFESLHDSLGELGPAGGVAAMVRAVRGARRTTKYDIEPPPRPRRSTSAGQAGWTRMTREDFAKRMRELRDRRGWTQEQMAERTGLASDTIRRLEYASFNPSLDTMRKIANGLDLPTAALLDDNFDKVDVLIRRLPEPHQRVAYAVLLVLQHDVLSSS